jgi:hypothetical protein
MPPDEEGCPQCGGKFGFYRYHVFALERLLEFEKVGVTCTLQCAETLKILIDIDEGLYAGYTGFWVKAVA